MKLIIFFLSISLFASNEELRAVQKNGITIVDNNKTIVIQRKNPKKCNNVHINPPTLFGGDFAAKDIPKECKKTFVTIFGVLQPMHLYKGVKTVGELEVLSHIKKSEKKSKKYILIDARTQQWYHQMTIPTAVNLPFNQLHRYEVLEEDDENKIDEFEEMIEILGIIQRKSYLDFSRCKSAVIFCNGSWCSQSQKMIIKLINLGYPEEKLLWYRGGMQDWVLNGFTVTKGKF